MSSAGDAAELEPQLRLLRAYLAAGVGRTLDDALVLVPEELRTAAAERYLEEQAAIGEEREIRRRGLAEISDTGGPRPWFAAVDTSTGLYWRRLAAYLSDYKDRSPADVAVLHDESDKVLSYLEDPRQSGPPEFLVKGLVLGYVQSGKTANFTALIAKAADIGYRLVIVLSGIHNTLRAQTQRRLAEELGLYGYIPTATAPGVGEPPFAFRWNSLTRPEESGDFRAGTVDANSALSGSQPVIAVVKKNATVLRRLVRWLGDGQGHSLPVLVVDDEADQASINTGGNRPPVEELTDLTEADLEGGTPDDELNPSVINGLIRGLLGRFKRVSYVAYTATPFANVLIDPDAVDEQAGYDLYPSDFILCLPCPSTYVGAEQIFGRAALEEDEESTTGLPVIEFVPDYDVDAVRPPGPDDPSVPVSLSLAIEDYALAAAARRHRNGRVRATMLIHTTHRVAQQNELGLELQEELEQLRASWRYRTDGALAARLQQRWENSFRPSLTAGDVTFDELRPHMDALLDGHPAVLVLNSHSDNRGVQLDFEQEPELTAVIVGGNRLSRGLTIEDLLVSYFVRASDTYDTLLQMGRWFGYRADYVDLTRLWTTADLASRFRHLALVEEELRRFIRYLAAQRIAPRLLGPRIRTHPAMTVTADNKMGSASPIRVSYSGELIQSTRFQLDQPGWLDANLAATRSLFGDLGVPSKGDGHGDTRPLWSNVPWTTIAEFLEATTLTGLQRHDSFAADHAARYIRRRATRGDELLRWTVSLRCADPDRADPTLGTEYLAVTGLPEVPCIGRSRMVSDSLSIGALIDPAVRTSDPRKGDEVVGLTDSQIDRARAIPEDRVQTYGHALRAQRPPGEGLLLIYPVSRYSKARPPSIDRDTGQARTRRRRDLFDDPEQGRTVIGVAVVFPVSGDDEGVEYIQGAAGRQYADQDAE